MAGQSNVPPFSLLAPPYRSFLPLDPEESFPRDRRIMWGTALIWNLDRGHADGLLDRVAERPAGVPLMVVLPPADRLAQLRDRVLAVTEEARPQTVMPFHPRLVPEEMASLLRREPGNIAEEFADYLSWRGLPLDQETRRIVRRTAELSAELRTLGALSRGVYLSRRALGRRFRKRGLPVPSHWLQFCRLLRAMLRLQNTRASLFEVACSLGYPDGFTLSNQMDRLVGVRPSEARRHLGWEWFVEAWLHREWLEGGLTVPLRQMPTRAQPQPGDGERERGHGLHRSEADGDEPRTEQDVGVDERPRGKVRRVTGDGQSESGFGPDGSSNDQDGRGKDQDRRGKDQDGRGNGQHDSGNGHDGRGIDESGDRHDRSRSRRSSTSAAGDRSAERSEAA